MNLKKPQPANKYLAPEHVRQLLLAAKAGATRQSERDYAILSILANHGARVSELCDLRMADIDLGSEPSIYIRHEKGGEPSVHPLYRSEVSALRSWLAVREEKVREGKVTDHDHLFVSEQGTRINRATINLLVSTVSRKAGLEHLKLHPHSFRSFCVSQRINRGENIVDVQDWVGHRSILTTRRYCKLAPNRFRKFGALV